MKPLIKATDNAIADWLSSIHSESLTFDISSKDATKGFFEDHFRVRLGTGDQCFRQGARPGFLYVVVE
ncbi:MAG: hypothetical protein ACKVHE_04810 [Planctomycetales bacterium]|jgi:hypothetical protein